ncbi:hypothetical protein BV20DRAFT_447310 [Pilatotrama ljubarskyi]|nr:hypothetical protein BV20DRAFT_447310 [Pilatotrama ljubarskyi]
MPDSLSEDGTFLFAADDADFISIQYTSVWTHSAGKFIGAYSDTGSIGAPGATASMLFSVCGVAAYAAIPKSLANLSDPDSLPIPNVTVRLDENEPTQVSIPFATNTPSASYASSLAGGIVSGALASGASAYDRAASLPSGSSVASNSPYGSRPRPKADGARVLSVPRRTTYHADSGVRFSPSTSANVDDAPTRTLDGAQDLADVPPSYSAK